jgi:glycosyltransferase involved in cell wall biosynthesis
MKIGIDARLWQESGVGRYIRNLVKNLKLIDRQNNYVLFVLPKDYKSVKLEIQSNQSRGKAKQAAGAVKNWKIVKADIKWHTLDEQINFPKILEKEKLDLVHFPYFSVPIFYKRPYVVTIHDLIIDHFPTGKASTLISPLYSLKLIGYKYVITTAADNAKRIITVSKTTKKEIIEHLKIVQEKIEVIYEAVDDKLEILPGSPLRKKHFLYVGNAYPHKNLNNLILAYAKFNKKNIPLILVGREDYFYKRFKEKVAKMKLSDKIIFRENVSDEELASLYKEAIALIMPSLMEGFGLPVLEAMANKCLVLASDIPSLHEICGKNAIFFDPNDPEKIYKKINFAYLNKSNRKIKALVQKAYDHTFDFSWQKVAKETLKVYENSLK